MRARTPWTFLLVVAAAATLFAAPPRKTGPKPASSATPEPSVSVVGVSVVTAGFGKDGSDVRPLMSRPGTRIVLAVRVAAPAGIVSVETRDSVLESVLDSAGEPLAAAEFDYSAQITPDGTAALLDVKAEGVPGEKAPTVRVKGRLALKLATGARTEKVAALRLEPGVSFRLGGATVKVHEVKAEGEHSTVHFKGPAAVLAAVKALRFVEAGQGVETRRSGFYGGADEAELSYYAPLKGRRVALEVDLFQNVKAVQAPIDVETGIGLSAAGVDRAEAAPAVEKPAARPSRGPQPAVALVGVRVAGPALGPETEPLQPLGTRPGTVLALAVNVASPAGILAVAGDAGSIELRDSEGGELEEPEFESGNADITENGQVGVLELRASGRPGQKATALVAAGTLNVRVSSGTKTEKVASVKLTPSSTFRLGGRTVTIAAAEASDEAVSISLAGQAAVVDGIKAMRFRAGGATVEARMTGGSWGGDEAMRYYSIPTKATTGSLEVDIWQSPKDVAVPFTLRTGLGLPRVAFATAGPPPPLPPLGTATGQLVVDGKPLRLAHVVAVSGPDTFDETKEAFTVLLTEKALDAGAIGAAGDLGAVAKAVDDGLVVTFGPGGGTHVRVRHPALAGNELQTSGGGKPLDVRGPDRVGGSVATWSDGKEQEFPGGHKVQYLLRFNAPIQKRFALEEPLVLAPTATRLGPGGGEAGKAYLAQQCAALPIDPKDPKAMEKALEEKGAMPTEEDLAAMSKEKGETVTKEDALKLMAALAELASAFRPKDCKVLGGAQDGHLAILQVEAMMMESRSRTDAYLIKDGGRWAFKKHGTWRSAN